MSATMIRIVERRIATAALRNILGEGLRVSVDSGGEEGPDVVKSTNRKEIIDATFAVDTCAWNIYEEEKRIGWVRFVMGNDGWDVISDYSDNMIANLLLKPAFELADRYS